MEGSRRLLYGLEPKGIPGRQRRFGNKIAVGRTQEGKRSQLVRKVRTPGGYGEIGAMDSICTQVGGGPATFRDENGVVT
jgi:hypothetical protein